MRVNSDAVYNLALELEGKIYPAEIKSVTDSNEEAQLL